MHVAVHPGQTPTDTPSGCLPVNGRGRVYDPAVPEDDRTFSMFGHLTVLVHLLVPVVAIANPIIMYLVKRKESPFIADHLREAINFQITLVIYSVLLPILATVLGVLTLGIGLILLVPAFILPYALGIIGMIMAALAANRGEYFRYPMTIRFLHADRAPRAHAA